MLGPGLSARAKPLASEPDPPGRTLRKPPETGDQHGARASRPSWRPITNIRPGGPPNRGAVQRREGPQQQRGQSHRGIPIARRAAVSAGPGARELPAPGQALVVVEAVEGRQEKRPDQHARSRCPSRVPDGAHRGVRGDHRGRASLRRPIGSPEVRVRQYPCERLRCTARPASSTARRAGHASGPLPAESRTTLAPGGPP